MFPEFATTYKDDKGQLHLYVFPGIDDAEEEAAVKSDEVKEPAASEVVTETDPDGGSVEGEE